jgi:hypothetical protein
MAYSLAGTVTGRRKMILRTDLLALFVYHTSQSIAIDDACKHIAYAIVFC